MPRSSDQRPSWHVAALVIVPALLGAAVSGYFGLESVEQKQRATGVVQLSEIAGNAQSGQLSPYAADLEAALQSASVRRQVQEAVGPASVPSEVEVERLSDASRVSISVEAESVRAASTALLAAGRAGYEALVEQQIRLLGVRERAALARLQSLGAQVNTARAAVQAAAPAQAVAARAALAQNERLMSIAVDDLSEVQGSLAVAAELRAGAPTTTAVVVDSVSPVSRLPEVLPIFGAGFVGGAIPGAIAAVLMRRRERSTADGRREPRADVSADGPPPARPSSLPRVDRGPSTSTSTAPTVPVREPVEELRAR